MTDPKKYLKQVKVYDAHINNQIEELTKLRALTLKVTTTLKEEATFGTMSQDKMGDAISKLVELQDSINESIDRFVDKKQEVHNLIEKLEDPEHVAVLYKLYILYKKWDDIGEEMHMTVRNAQIIHGKALLKVSELLKEGEEDG